jgi:hypothetical protein
MSNFDHRDNPRVAEVLKALPKMAHVPHVGAADLEEVRKVLAGLPALKYPIASAGELLDQLKGHDIQIEGGPVDPARMIKYVPSHYFPLTSPENFVEKMAELIRANRKAVDVPGELASIHKQLPRLSFPIQTADELLKQVGADKTYKFQGGDVKPPAIMHRIPAQIFPIESETDFDGKIGALMWTRPLIVRD